MGLGAMLLPTLTQCMHLLLETAQACSVFGALGLSLAVNLFPSGFVAHFGCDGKADAECSGHQRTRHHGEHDQQIIAGIIQAADKKKAAESSATIPERGEVGEEEKSAKDSFELVPFHKTATTLK